MSIINKILGLIMMGIGLGVWYLDVIIFRTLGLIATWIAKSMGLIEITFGIMLIIWILGLGIMVSILVIGGLFIIGGVDLMV